MTNQAVSGDPATQFEQYRVELTGYCYRMLGSAFEAEDAVQETLLRAWRNVAGFEGRSSPRTWLYKIASNVCLDMLDGAQRRARPMDLTSPGTADSPLGDVLPETTWVLPIPNSRVMAGEGNPADVALARESIRLAFVAALQYLPPPQRAALILCEVLDWKASEVAELIGTSVASVNSALQRARASLAAHHGAAITPASPPDDRHRALLARYVAAFEAYDMDKLTALLYEDATWSMPPFPLWLRGHQNIRRFCLGTGAGCEGSHLVPTVANGSPAFGQYKPDGQGGFTPWALQVLELSDGQITGICFFLDTARLFPLFGLPLHWPG